MFLHQSLAKTVGLSIVVIVLFAKIKLIRITILNLLFNKVSVQF